MARRYHKNRSTANVGPRDNRKYKDRQSLPRTAGIPEGQTRCLTLFPLRVFMKENRKIRAGNYVYAIQCADRVKFGVSKSPFVRLSDLQVANVDKCDLRMVVDCGEQFSRKGVERAIHLLLNSARINGEWFSSDRPAVRCFTDSPHRLPWKAIEVMTRLGYEVWLEKSTYPKSYRPRELMKMLKAVKGQFEALEWAKR